MVHALSVSGVRWTKTRAGTQISNEVWVHECRVEPWPQSERRTAVHGYLQVELVLRRLPLCHVIALIYTPLFRPGAEQVQVPEEQERREEAENRHRGLEGVVPEPPLLREVCNQGVDAVSGEPGWTMERVEGAGAVMAGSLSF